jgi:16S rRNA (adenine1518-N6/adenine1519-N6)-dimethyltransferase
MDLTNLNDLRLAMQLAGLKASKGLGQHFLVDRLSLDAVMVAGELTPEDTVLEIGPGLGTMTVPLTQAVSQVVAVEQDPVLAQLLERDRPTNLKVVAGDIMQFDLGTLPEGYKVVANIPYYLTSNLLRRLLEAENQPQLLSLLIQKEVAQRVVAKPGKMSILAVSVQYYGQPEVVQMVPRQLFWPPPNVDSAILQIRVGDQPAFEADRDKLFRLVKAGFGERRKMLKNSLAGGLNMSMELAAGLLDAAGLAPTARAQELSLPEWERLYRETVRIGVV